MGDSEPPAAKRYGDVYCVAYRDTVLGTVWPGTTGAKLIFFDSPAGRYAMPETCDFSIVVFQSGGFGATVNLGRGPFNACVAPGLTLVVPPHAATEIDLGDRARGLILTLDEDRVSALLNVPDATAELSAPRLYAAPLCDPLISTAIQQMWSASGTHNGKTTLFCDSAIAVVFAALARHASANHPKRSIRGGLSTSQLKRVMQVLEARWSENIPLTSLASAANLSPYHFARTFKQSTGLPPQEYHRQLRMSKAKELLAQTPLSITDIALHVGYSSSQAFSRFFRRDTGLTPHEYRDYAKDGRASHV